MRTGAIISLHKRERMQTMRIQKIKHFLLLAVWGLTAVLLSGCGMLFGNMPQDRAEGREKSPVTVEITFDPDTPEEVAVALEAESAPIESAEITVTCGSACARPAVTVQVRLH